MNYCFCIITVLATFGLLGCDNKANYEATDRKWHKTTERETSLGRILASSIRTPAQQARALVLLKDAVATASIYENAIRSAKSPKREAEIQLECIARMESNIERIQAMLKQWEGQ